MPARFEVRAESTLDMRWSGWFGGMRIEIHRGETVLTGTVQDQPALHGVLNKLRDLGVSVISVRRLSAEGQEREQR